MSGLPVISGKQCIKALEKIGFVVKRQSGSHVILRRNDPYCQISVPNHKVLDRGTLRAKSDSLIFRSKNSKRIFNRFFEYNLNEEMFII